MATSKLNVENLDFLLTMDAPREKKTAKVGGGANRDAKITTLLTSARDSGMVVLQAETVLEGWTRVHKERVTADVTPQSIAAMIERRAKTARELAKSGVDHDADYLGITVIASTGLKPSQNARLGGRFYIVHAPGIGDIEDANYRSMVDDVDDRAANALTSVRPLSSE